MTGQTTAVAPTRAGLSALLEHEIVSGRFVAGSKLPSEREMAGRYRVSRPVVREAMRGLVERQLVEVVPGRGAFVRAARSTDAAPGMDALLRRRQPTPRDMVEARTMLEATAAALAADRADRADLAAMDDALAGFDRSPHLVEQARFDLALHLAIARAAHNPVVETMFGAIAGLTIELMLRSLGDPMVAPISLPYHRAIVEAIRARDPDGARAAMVDHLQVAARTYGADFDRPLDSAIGRDATRLLGSSLTLDALLVAAPDGGSDGER